MNFDQFSPLRRGDNGPTGSFLTVKYKKKPKTIALVIQIVDRHDIFKIRNYFCDWRTFTIFGMIYRSILAKNRVIFKWLSF